MQSSISDSSVKHDVIVTPPRTRLLHTPVLSEVSINYHIIVTIVTFYS